MANPLPIISKTKSIFLFPLECMHDITFLLYPSVLIYSWIPRFYIYFKIHIILIRRFLYCIRTRISSREVFLVYCYFYRYLAIVFLLSCMSYLCFIWRWLSLYMYSSGVDENKECQSYRYGSVCLIVKTIHRILWSGVTAIYIKIHDNTIKRVAWCNSTNSFKHQ